MAGVTVRWDRWLVAASTGALGVAGVVALAGALTSNLEVLVGAGLLGGVGLGVLVAARWIGPLLLVVLTLPLPALYASEDLRLSPVLPVSAVVVVAWLFRSHRTGWSELGGPARALGALVGAIAVATLFAEVPVTALRELLTFGLFLGLLVVAGGAVQGRPALAGTAAWALAGTAGVAGAAAVLESLGAVPGRFPLAGTGLFRAAGGFGWPNELGMYLAITLPFCVYTAASTRRWLTRVVAMGLLAMTAAGLAATFSRGSWLAVLAAPGALVLVGGWRTAVRFWGGALLAALVADLLTGGALSTRVAGTTGDVLVAQRLLLTAAGLLMFQAHPIVGVGPGGFGDALERFGVQVSGLFDYVGSAHNGYVHMAAEAGILGLVGLLAFFGWTLLVLGPAARRAGSRDDVHGRRLATAFYWSFATVCLVSLFEWPFAHGVGELIVVVAGAGLASAGAKAVL